MESEETRLLKEAMFEITLLRRTNEIQSARLDMFDSMTQLLHTTPAHNGKAMSPDLVWEIQKFIDSKKGA
jgi:hypothetical protein